MDVAWVAEKRGAQSGLLSFPSPGSWENAMATPLSRDHIAARRGVVERRMLRNRFLELHSGGTQLLRFRGRFFGRSPTRNTNQFTPDGRVKTRQRAHAGS